MDFFWNTFFGPNATETRTDLESEEDQVLVDFDNGGGQCVVA